VQADATLSVKNADDEALLLQLENPNDDVKLILSQQPTYSKAVLEKMMCCGDMDITGMALNYLSSSDDSAPATPELSSTPVELVAIPTDFRDLRSLLESQDKNNDLEAFTALFWSISQSEKVTKYTGDHDCIIVDIIEKYLNTRDLDLSNKRHIATKKTLITTFTKIRDKLNNYQYQFPAIIAGILDFVLANDDSQIETLIFDDLLNKPLLGNKLAGRQLIADHVDDKALCYNLCRYYAVNRLEQQLLAFIPKALELGVPVKQFKDAA